MRMAKMLLNLLDTDHVTLIDRGGQACDNILARIRKVSFNEITVSSISYEEQLRGWLAVLNTLGSSKKQIDGYLRLERMLDFYCATPILQFDAKAIAEFDRLKQAKIGIGTMDTKIAAIALANNTTVLTRNFSDFGKIPGLRIEDWSV